MNSQNQKPGSQKPSQHSKENPNQQQQGAGDKSSQHDGQKSDQQQPNKK